MKNGSTHKSTRQTRAGNGRWEPAGSLEASIMGMARRGELAKAAQSAIRRLRRKGVPVTFRRGDQIIRQHGDGRKEILGTVQRVAYRIPKGVKIIEES